MGKKSRKNRMGAAARRLNGLGGDGASTASGDAMSIESSDFAQSFPGASEDALKMMGSVSKGSAVGSAIPKSVSTPTKAKGETPSGENSAEKVSVFGSMGSTVEKQMASAANVAQAQGAGELQKQATAKAEEAQKVAAAKANEVKQEAVAKVEEKKTEVSSYSEEQKAEIAAKVEAKRAEIAAQVKAKQAEVAAQVEEKKREIAAQGEAAKAKAEAMAKDTQKSAVTASTEEKVVATSKDIPSLNEPAEDENKVKQNDCGCVIL
mmetsp:Transcript_503/g.681  ORF Transcript_503/g.681 Transcript_503/m.681 type:complete len:264 (-) Transcript_503:281-1072(-)